MKKILIGTALSISMLLAGCSGGDDPETTEEKVEEKVVFNENNFLNAEDMNELFSLNEKLNEEHGKIITNIDDVVKNNYMKNHNKDFYFEGTLNMSIDEVLQRQILSHELHKEYMKLLSENDASQIHFILQNRIFKENLRKYEGQRYVEKNITKHIIEKAFMKYNIQELDVILKEEDIGKFIDDYDKWEESIAILDWYKHEANANFEGELFEIYKILPKELSNNDKLLASKLIEKVTSVEIMMSKINFSELTDPKTELAGTLENLNNIKKEINETVFTEENQWIEKRASNEINRYIKAINLFIEGKTQEGYDELITDIYRMEDLVSLKLIGKEVGYDFKLKGEETINESEVPDEEQEEVSTEEVDSESKDKKESVENNTEESDANSGNE